MCACVFVCVDGCFDACDKIGVFVWSSAFVCVYNNNVVWLRHVQSVSSVSEASAFRELCFDGRGRFRAVFQGFLLFCCVYIFAIVFWLRNFCWSAIFAGKFFFSVVVVFFSDRSILFLKLVSVDK